MQSGKRKKLTVGDVFNTDDDDSADGAKKRKLVPLDYDDEKIDKKPSTAEEKRAKIKTLIESIPTAKDELFAYSLDWSIVDQVRYFVLLLSTLDKNFRRQHSEIFFLFFQKLSFDFSCRLRQFA